MLGFFKKQRTVESCIPFENFFHTVNRYVTWHGSEGLLSKYFLLIRSLLLNQGYFQDLFSSALHLAFKMKYFISLVYKYSCYTYTVNNSFICHDFLNIALSIYMCPNSVPFCPIKKSLNGIECIKFQTSLINAIKTLNVLFYMFCETKLKLKVPDWRSDVHENLK